MRVQVSLERDLDENEKLGPVHAPFYPAEKVEGWWLIVGDPHSNQLLAIKRVTLAKAQLNTSLEFEVCKSAYFVCTLMPLSAHLAALILFYCRRPPPAALRPCFISCLTRTWAAIRSSTWSSRSLRHVSFIFVVPINILFYVLGRGCHGDGLRRTTFYLFEFVPFESNTAISPSPCSLLLIIVVLLVLSIVIALIAHLIRARAQ